MNILLRIIAAGFMILASLFFGIAAYWNLSGSDGIDYTMKRNAEIRIELQAKAKIVDQYIAKHGQLPPFDFFDCCTVSKMDKFFQNWEGSQAWSRSSFDKLELTQPYEATDYVLDYWRGEWFEAYASQTGKMTLPLDRSEYYIFGNRRGDGVFWSTLTLILFGAAILTLLWKRSHNSVFVPEAEKE